MADERRSARRARLAGVRITYESASGDRVEADALDLARGGLFVRTAKPLAVGKRISLEIQVLGKPGPWSALGRVVWTRESGDADRPPGMGVKLIDVEDGVVTAIDRLVETREPTEPGVGGPTKPAHLEMPARRRDASIPIDLVARKKEENGPPSTPAAAAAAGSPGAAKRGATGRLVVLSVLATVAGGAGYVLFEGLVRPPTRVAPVPALPGTTAARPTAAAGAATSTHALEPPTIAAPPAVSAPAEASTPPAGGASGAGASSTPPGGASSKKPSASAPAAPAHPPAAAPKRSESSNPY